MRSQYIPKIIFSAFQEGCTKNQNIINSDLAEQFLIRNNISYMHAKGVYKGVTENSFIVPFSIETFRRIHLICREFNQESVLIMDNEGTGKLLYLSKFEDEFNFSKLGHLKVYDKPPRGDYTKVKDGNRSLYFNFV